MVASRDIGGSENIRLQRQRGDDSSGVLRQRRVQRPSNEQTNGLLRRRLPNSTNLDVGAVRLAVIADNLNHMPRQTTQLEVSTHHIHSTKLQPPLESAEGDRSEH